MKKIFLGLFVLGFGLTNLVNSQNTEHSQKLIAKNYKYLKFRWTENASSHVKDLKAEVLKYNHKELSELYDNEYETVSVTFDTPKGNINATYDKNGKIIKTIEKYNNVILPLHVTQAVAKSYPNWSIVEDVYLVKYHCDKNELEQEYMVKIKKADEVITLETNEKGDFL